MAITYTYFQQDNAVDSWIVEETDGEGTIVSKYVIYDNPNVKPSIQNIEKISAESADFSGSLLVTGSVKATAGFTGSLQGTSTNADVATILQTARTIGGVSFNGSANINLPGVNTTGNQNTSGNAATATTASFATTASSAVSSSFATTSSYATVAQTVANSSSFALVGSPNTFTSNQIIQGYLDVNQTLSQGTGIANGQYSHAQGLDTTAGYYGYYSDNGPTAGVFALNSSYGDLTSIFVPNSFALLDDPSGGITGTSDVLKFEVSSSIYIGENYTEVTLFDTTINFSSNPVVIGIFGTPQPAGADYATIGQYSHAEGESTTTTGLASHAEGYGTLAQGYYSHAEGLSTVALGNYQHVQGQYNISSSVESAFIHGNGTSDASRSNLIFASGSQVQITGSLIVSGSGTFTNIGPAVFSGSVTSTAGFTGSLQGTATTASFVQNAISSSFASTASFVSGAVGGSGTVGAIAKFSGTATIANATADTDYLINSVNTIAYTAMGSTIKGNGVAVEKPHNMTANNTLTAGTVFFIAYYLSKAETITGVKWQQGTLAAGSSGSFGLYSVSGGTITLQASSSFDTTVFSTSQNTFKSKAFTSTYAAPAGLYYIGVLSTANSAIVGGIFAYNASIYGADFSNSNKVVTTRVTSSLPPTQALSGCTSTQTAPGLFLY